MYSAFEIYVFLLCFSLIWFTFLPQTAYAITLRLERLGIKDVPNGGNNPPLPNLIAWWADTEHLSTQGLLSPPVSPFIQAQEQPSQVVGVMASFNHPLPSPTQPLGEWMLNVSFPVAWQPV